LGKKRNARHDILVEKPCGDFIFELKACDENDDMDAKALEALAQIDTKRYGADTRKDTRLIKVGIAFYKKQCCVKVGT